MDSLTHIYFAERLLNATGKDISAAVCSLFPQIDREPAYFHRMYGHPYPQVAALAEIGTYVYANDAIAGGHEGEYAWTRFHEERDRMVRFVDEYEDATGQSLEPFDPDSTSVVIAYASHTYQDIFNNPMQGFLPYSVYPCGKWELWSSLDPIHFRTTLYQPENIAAFRQEFFTDPVWDVSLEPSALVKAMVERTAVASLVQLPRAVVEDTYASLGLEQPDSRELAEATEFLIAHEEILARLMRKYSGEAAPVPVGVGPKVSAEYPVGS